MLRACVALEPSSLQDFRTERGNFNFLKLVPHSKFSKQKVRRVAQGRVRRWSTGRQVLHRQVGSLIPPSECSWPRHHQGPGRTGRGRAALASGLGTPISGYILSRKVHAALRGFPSKHCFEKPPHCHLSGKECYGELLFFPTMK